MIGKAKIFLYALFTPNKHVPVGRFAVKWYHKCLLVYVRQFKNFKECPSEIRYFEWDKATAKFSVHWDRAKMCLGIIGACYLGLHLRNKEMAQTEKMYEERKAKGLPRIPPYDMPLIARETWYTEYNTEFPADYKYP